MAIFLDGLPGRHNLLHDFGVGGLGRACVKWWNRSVLHHQLDFLGNLDAVKKRSQGEAEINLTWVFGNRQKTS